MTNMKQKLAGTLLVAFMGIGLAAPATVKASEAGHRNTALGLGAVTGYFIHKRQVLPAVLAGAGAVVAYKHSTDAMASRHRREHQAAYGHAYRSGYYSGHEDGRYATRRAYYNSRTSYSAGRVYRHRSHRRHR